MPLPGRTQPGCPHTCWDQQAHARSSMGTGLRAWASEILQPQHETLITAITASWHAMAGMVPGLAAFLELARLGEYRAQACWETN